MNKKIVILISILIFSNLSFAQTYKKPPDVATFGYVPVISDSKMQECVVLYNKAEWLQEEMELIIIDNYSEESVNSFNKKLNKHTSMIDKFNLECSGKQSLSSCKEVEKLNKQNGIESQKCE
jgi:hypothetical protein